MLLILFVIVVVKVPEEEVRLEEELVHCVMILLNKPQGLMTLEASSDLLPLLAVSCDGAAADSMECSAKRFVFRLRSLGLDILYWALYMVHIYLFLEGCRAEGPRLDGWVPPSLAGTAVTTPAALFGGSVLAAYR